MSDVRPTLGQSQRQTQSMVLGQRQLLGVEVLQLPSADLAAWLREAFEANECLSLEEPERPPAPPGERRGPLQREASDRHAEWLANLADPAADWRDDLGQELSWLELPPDRERWVEFLIERLDDAGLLTEDDASLLAAAEVRGLPGGEAALGRGVGDLQRLEPKGVGGRDAVEALLLQLAPEDPDYERLCALIERFLDDLCRNKLPAVARALAVEMPELERLVARLGQLDLRPLQALAASDAPTLRPDLVALPEEGPEGRRLRLEFPRSSLPTVTVDPRLAARARDPESPGDLRRYLKRRVGEAKAVVEAVEARRATLERVARAVFERQLDYLCEGPGHLVPLSMSELAEELELHVSTVSRAVAGKHVQTPHGVEPLRRFFQTASGGGTAGSAGGTAVDRVRERVRAIVAAEDTAAPLSDDGIAAVLAGEGLEVARRTVAKYRRELDIPSSYRRRRFR